MVGNSLSVDNFVEGQFADVSSNSIERICRGQEKAQLRRQ